jgi:hypothetical protein
MKCVGLELALSAIPHSKKFRVCIAWCRIATGKAAACRMHVLSTPLRRSQLEARSCGSVLSCRCFAPQQYR